MVRKMIGTFKKKDCKNKSKKFRIEKVIDKSDDKLYVNGKDMIINLTVGLIKEMLYNNESMFS